MAYIITRGNGITRRGEDPIPPTPVGFFIIAAQHSHKHTHTYTNTHACLLHKLVTCDKTPRHNLGLNTTCLTHAKCTWGTTIV